MQTEYRALRIEQVDTSAAEAARSEHDDSLSEEYAARRKEGDQFPAFEVYVEKIGDGDERFWCWDGHYRVEAWRLHGEEFIQARCAPGKRPDAVWASYSANTRHGVPRTREDTQRLVREAIRNPRSKDVPDAELGRHLGVSRWTINRARKEMGLPTMRRGAPPHNPQQLSQAFMPPPDEANKCANAHLFSSEEGGCGTHEGETDEWFGAQDGSPEPSEGSLEGPSEAPSEKPPIAPAESEALVDVDGRPIPKRLHSVWQKKARVQEAIKKAASLRAEVNKLSSDPDIGGHLHWASLRQHFENVSVALKYAEPHALCPWCKGQPKGCQACRKTGWVGKPLYRQAAKDKQ